MKNARTRNIEITQNDQLGTLATRVTRGDPTAVQRFQTEMPVVGLANLVLSGFRSLATNDGPGLQNVLEQMGTLDIKPLLQNGDQKKAPDQMEAVVLQTLRRTLGSGEEEIEFNVTFGGVNVLSRDCQSLLNWRINNRKFSDGQFPLQASKQANYLSLAELISITAQMVTEFSLSEKAAYEVF